MMTNVQFDPASVARFGALVRELNGTVRRNGAEAAKFAATTFVYSCRAATPMGRKTRRIVDNPGAGPRKALLVFRQGAPPKLVPVAAPKSHPLYNVNRRGLARMIWTFAAVKAGLTKGGAPESASGETVKGARALSDGAKRTRDGMAEFEVANTAPYIQTLDQGGPHNPPHRIMARGLTAASKRLEWILTQHARRMARAWN